MRYFSVFLILLCLICGCGEAHLTQVFFQAEGETLQITGVPPDVQAMLWLDPETETEKLLALEADQPDWVADAIEFRICKATQQRLYYTKYIDAGGIAILGNDAVADEAFLIARYIVLRMTAKRPELRQWLTPAWGHYTILASVETSIQEIPEYGCDPTNQPAVKCGYASGRWTATDLRAGCRWETFIHEFAHSLHYVIKCYEEKTGFGRYGHCYYDAPLALESSDFQTRLETAYLQAIDAGTWTGRYAETNRGEYWAEGVLMWYYGIGADREFQTHAEFAEHDPLLAELLSEWFAEESFYE